MTDASRSRTEHFVYAAATDIGMRRLNNQDSFVALIAETDEVWQTRGDLFAVADGMGAHAAGELASKMAVEAISHHYRQYQQVSPPEAILQSVRDANQEIHQRGMANSEFHNMGTTCSVLLLLPQGALVAHVGDSRVYRIRGCQLQQLTFDHSLVWEMRTAGSFADRDPSINIPKNVITRSLGPQSEVQVDLEGPLDMAVGDTFLLCSDGLTAHVEDAEIGLIAGHLPPPEAVQLLVDLANLRGGPDNITVLAIRVETAVDAHRSPPLVVGQEFRPQRRVHLGAWVALLVSVLIAAGLAVVQLWNGVMMALLGAIIAAGVAWWQRFGAVDGVALSSGNRLGRSPYVKADCDPSPARLSRLAASIHEAASHLSDADGDEVARAAACLEEAKTRASKRDPSGALTMLAVATHLLTHHRRA